MPSFEIPDGPTTIQLKSTTDKGQTIRTGTASFTVTNKSGGTVRASFGIEPQGDAKAAWFDIPGEKERSFADKETQKINVDIKAPGNAAVGDYKFRFVAVNVNQTDTDFTKSAVVTFNVAQEGKPPPPPNWGLIIGIIAGVVLLVGGGLAAWFLMKPVPPPQTMVAVPGVVGQTYTAADTMLKAKGLVAKQRDVVAGKPPGIVAAQDPAEKTQLAKGGTVNLDVGKGVKVPDVRTKSPDVARQQLLDSGFNNVTVSMGPATGAVPNTIVSQVPEQNTDADAATPVTLTIDPGLSVPDRMGWMLPSIGDAFSGFNVTVGQRAEAGTVNQIVDISPPPGTVLKKNSPVTLTVRVAPCPFHICVRNRVPYKDYVRQMKGGGG
jgi:serine/threonine-protein kinase